MLRILAVRNVAVALWVSKLYSGVARSSQIFYYLNVSHSAFIYKGVHFIKSDRFISCFYLFHLIIKIILVTFSKNNNLFYFSSLTYVSLN